MYAAYTARSSERLVALCAPGFVRHDHRVLGFGAESALHSFARSTPALWELAPDITARMDHLRLTERGFLDAFTQTGTYEGGAFEIAITSVHELDERGRMSRIDWYGADTDHLRTAFARFEELGRSAAPPARDPLAVPPNTAVRTWDRWYAAMLAGDDEGVRALHADSYRSEDRRQVLRAIYLRDDEVSWAQWLRDGGWRATRTLLATAGDRLALQCVLWKTSAGGADSEIEWLELDEASADGLAAAVVLFDSDARAAAHEEMFQRNLRLGGQGAPPAVLEMVRAINARDMAALRAVLCNDFVAQDHRRLGFGTIEGADAYVDSVRAYQALSRDARLDALYVAAISERGGVAVNRTFGTNLEGGAFDTLHVGVSLVRDGRVARTENYDIEDLAVALARFEELGRSTARDPLRIPPNAATRTEALRAQAFAAEDWDAQRALASADFRFEDRTKRALVSGDVETWIRSGQYLRSEAGAEIEARLLSTLGERIEIHSVVLRATRSGDDFEIEGVHLTEVDAAGKLRAFIRFDAEDRAAAFEEAEARFIAGEAAAVGGQAPIAALNRAIAHEDWHALRESLTADFEMRDLRTLGHGVLAGEAWIDSMRALARLGSRVRVEYLRLLVWNRHGRVTVARTAGLNESGGEFEIVAIGVLLTEGDRVALLERYDLADAERALARFEALCAEREKQGA